MKRKSVDCTSRFLTGSRRNYYLLELEMLAVAWGYVKDEFISISFTSLKSRDIS